MNDQTNKSAALKPLIDVNASVGRWPSRRLWGEEMSQLVQKLQEHQVSSAWVASLEGLLHRDVSGVNSRLAESCQREGRGLIQPFGTIDPTLPDWEEDLRRCHEVHRMRGIRLHPNYHGYALDDPRFGKLAALATERGLLMQIAVTMEDERTQHPLLRVKPVLTPPLLDVLKTIPRARVMLLNAMRPLRGNAPLLRHLINAGVGFDAGMLEGTAALENLLAAEPNIRILCGSHAPFF